MNEKVKSNTFTAVRHVDGKIVFDFPKGGADGSALASITFDPDKVSAVNRARAMMHGFEQRIRDGAALMRDAETGLPATPEAKRARMLRLAEHLMSGSDVWEVRASAEPRADDPGLLAASVIRALGLPDQDAFERLIARTMAKRSIDRTAALKVWQDTAEVKAAKAAILAERAAAKLAYAKTSAADMLADIMDEGDEDDSAPF